MVKHSTLFFFAALSTGLSAMQHQARCSFNPSQEARALVESFRQGQTDSVITNRFTRLWTKFQRNFFNVDGGGAVPNAVVHNLVFVEAFLILAQDAGLEGALEALFFGAADEGALGTIHLLLDNHFNSNIRNEINATPLHYAAGAGHLDIVKLLVEYVHVDVPDNRLQTALDWARNNEHAEVVKFLLSRQKQTTEAEFVAAPRLILHRTDGNLPLLPAADSCSSASQQSRQ